MKNSQKGFIVPIIILAVLVGAGATYYFKSKQSHEGEQSSQVEMQPQTVPENISSQANVKPKSTQPKLAILPFEGRKADSLSVQERQQYYDAALKLDSNMLFSLWKQYEEKQSDPQKEGFISIALSDKLTLDSNKPNGVVYGAISSFLNDINIKIGSKIYLVKILGQVPTVPALQTLLNVLSSQTDRELVIETKIAIVSIASRHNKSSSDQELSSLLEKSYEKSTSINDRATFAGALAKIGTPSGVALLLRDAIQSGKNDPNFARYALLEVRNPSAISILAKGLGEQSADNMELIVSGETLAAMGQPEATKAIVDWAKSADSTKASLVKSWLSQMRDAASIKLVKYTIEDNEVFKSEAVRNAVKDAFYAVQ